MGKRLLYDDVDSLIVSKGCKLVTNKEEFEKHTLRAKAKLNIVSACGHPNIITFDMFKAQGCGVLCKLCAKKQSFDNRRHLDVACTDIEHRAFIELRNMLDMEFDVQKMPESTKADFVIRPKEHTHDEWVALQLKATYAPRTKNSNNYQFRLDGKDYSDMTLVLYCLQDKRCWVVPYDKVAGLHNIAIGYTKSMYSCFQVSIDDWYVRWRKCYHDGIKKPLCEWKLQRPKSAQTEDEYRRFRESHLPYLQFEYPERDGLCYDFIVKGARVQEKVATVCKKNNVIRPGFYICNLSRKMRKYVKGENDLYWIAIPGTSLFFLFSEDVLIKRGFVTLEHSPLDTSSMLPLDIHGLTWTKDYLHDYACVTPEYMNQILTTKTVLPCRMHNETWKTRCQLRREAMSNAIGKKIKRISGDDGLCIVYPSLSDAARQNGIARQTIVRRLHTGCVHDGYLWKFA